MEYSICYMVFGIWATVSIVAVSIDWAFFEKPFSRGPGLIEGRSRADPYGGVLFWGPSMDPIKGPDSQVVPLRPDLLGTAPSSMTVLKEKKYQVLYMIDCDYHPTARLDVLSTTSMEYDSAQSKIPFFWE